MNSTFTGLNIATSGLYTASANLLVTTTNISNVDTDGYSQKVATQSAVGPAAVYSGNYVGSGSEVTSIDRVRSTYLDERYWEENGDLGELQTKADTITGDFEDILGDVDDNEFSTALSTFTTALEEMQSDISSTDCRQAVITDAETICTDLNSYSQQLTALREDLNSQVYSTVEQINSYAEQIADLNNQISQMEASGGETSDLEDQRTLLLDKLSNLVDIDVTETTVGTLPDGSDQTELSVTINGSTLVSGNTAKQLQCEEDADGMYQVSWEGSGDSFEPSGGELKAYLDLRDGDGTDSDFKGVVYYLNQLDDFASTFASAFNAVHTAGYDSNGDQGEDFFVASDGSSTITAANISVSSTISDDPTKLAASSSSDTSETDNGENLDDLVDLLTGSTMFGDCSATDAWTTIITTLGMSGEQLDTLADQQSSYVDSIDTRRTSVSGVSTNEETANLTKYQEAYNASAQIVSMWNEVFETTIDMVSD